MTVAPARAEPDAERSLVFTIGPWRFCGEDGVLSRAGIRRRLEDRAARTLVLLCRRRGQVVSQQELLAEVWNGRVVSSNSVSIVIGDIRRVLDDDPSAPSHIETVPKRGYRLRPATEPPATVADQPRDPPIFRRAVIAVGAASGLGALGLVVWRANTPSSSRIVSEPVQNDTGRPELNRLARSLGTLVDLQLAKLPGVVLMKGGDIRPNGLLFQSKLILWNEQPTLSLEAIDPGSRTVRWAGMASGPAPVLAANTIAQIEKFSTCRRGAGCGG